MLPSADVAAISVTSAWGGVWMTIVLIGQDASADSAQAYGVAVAKIDVANRTVVAIEWRTRGAVEANFMFVISGLAWHKSGATLRCLDETFNADFLR